MFLRALPALILLASAASAAAAAEFTLKFGTIYARDSSGFAEVMLPLKKRLEEQSNGRLEIELGGLGEFSRPAALLSLVEQGKVEIGMTVQGYHPGRFPLSAVMELPLIYETAEQGTFAMWQLFAEGPIAKDYADFKLLATYTLPPYGILSAVKVETLKDLRGLRVRAPSLAVGLALNRLGMIPVGLPLDWIGMGLAQNHIDAITYGFESAATAAGDGGKRLLEQVTHLLDARIAAPALMIAMNKSAFDKLPADLRGVIDANFGLEFSLMLARRSDGSENARKQALLTSAQHRMVPLTQAQREEIARRVRPVVDDWIADVGRQGHDGRAVLERARALVRSRGVAG